MTAANIPLTSETVSQSPFMSQSAELYHSVHARKEVTNRTVLYNNHSHHLFDYESFSFN